MRVSMRFILAAALIDAATPYIFGPHARRENGFLVTHSKLQSPRLDIVSSYQVEQPISRRTSLFSASSTPFPASHPRTIFYSVIAIVRSWFTPLVGVVAALFVFASKASARVSKTAATVPWDLYGRVPYDDWLFTTWRLTDPNLLKRSFVECINDEVGIALANYKHHRRLFEVSTTGKFMLVSLAALAVFNAFLNVAQDVARRQRIREDELRGYSVPLSAFRKGATVMGRQIEGMAEGWLDMELPAEDENQPENDNKGKGKDNTKGKGKDKKPDDEDENDE